MIKTESYHTSWCKWKSRDQYQFSSKTRHYFPC